MPTTSPSSFFADATPAAMNGNSMWAQQYWRELKSVAVNYANRLPRNVQRHLGPSELGHECDRLLIAKMSGYKMHSDNHITDPWASMVGTAIHAFLEQAFDWDNKDKLVARAYKERWKTETKVCPDPQSLQSHPGTADLYDADTFTLVDHKGLSLSTAIPTPSGWTTMGQLQAGDTVLGADGKPCKVTRTYPVQYRDCYRVTFKGGMSVVTDDVQLWEVTRNRNGGSGYRKETVLLSSAKMQEQLRAANGQRHLRVRTVAVDLPEAELPIHPYVLGAWLGDGDSSSGLIGVGPADREIFSHVISCGYSLGKLSAREDGFLKHTVLGLSRQLQDAGLIEVTGRRAGNRPVYTGHKRIPEVYLRASYGQRLALLQGLMDTDGSHNQVRNQCVFTSVSKELAYQVEELAASLGWKSYTCSGQAHGFGVSTTAYQVMFTPVGSNPFRLSRKAELVKPKNIAGAEYRIVQSVEPVLSVPTKCVDVDGPDHLYLVTEQFIPTHNCQGDTARDKLRRHGPPQHYYIQMLLYAIGYMYLGMRVDRVALVSWPRTKSYLDEGYVWEHLITPEDFDLVKDVLGKTEVREAVAKEVNEGRLSIWDIPMTPSPEDCQFCPLFRPQAASDPTVVGCPGTSRK